MEAYSVVAPWSSIVCCVTRKSVLLNTARKDEWCPECKGLSTEGCPLLTETGEEPASTAAKE